MDKWPDKNDAQLVEWEMYYAWRALTECLIDYKKHKPGYSRDSNKSFVKDLNMNQWLAL